MEGLVPGKQVPLILRRPFVEPLLAKFDDARSKYEVGLDEAEKPLQMWKGVEEIQEFESETVEDRDRGSEYWKQKQARRYHRKRDETKIFLKDSNAEGRSFSSSGARRVDYEGSKQNSKIQLADGAKYVLLKLSDAGDHVTVMPAGEWYSFRKTATQEAATSLDDVDHAFDQQQLRKKEANRRYRAISKVLDRGDKEDEARLGGGEGSNKVKTGRTLFTGVHRFTGSGDMDGGVAEAKPVSDGPTDAFGDAQATQLRKDLRRKRGRQAVDPTQDDKAESHMENWDNQYGDWGVDKDGDVAAEDVFDEGASDDDASFVAEEQEDLEGRENYDGGRLDEEDDMFGSDGEETSSDEETDEERVRRYRYYMTH